MPTPLRTPSGPDVLTPRASFACKSVFRRTVTGRNEVRDFVTNCQKHRSFCQVKAEVTEGNSAGRVISGARDTAGSTPKKTERPGGLIPDLSG